MTRQTLISVFLLGICAVTGGIHLASADTSYDISIDDSILTPDKTITIEGDTHSVSAVSRVAPGDQVVADVTAPSETVYRVYLYDGDRRIVAQERGVGSQTVTFEMANYDPGSYMLALSKDGEFKAVHPVVVRGYQVDISVLESEQESLDVSVSVTNEESSESPSVVKVVVREGSTVYQETAERQSSGVYQATVSLVEVADSEYQVYAFVQGSDDAFQEGQKEVLGISDAKTVSSKHRQTTTQRSANPPSQSTTTTERTTIESPTSTISTSTPTTTSSDTTPSTSTATIETTQTTQSTQTATPGRSTPTTDSVITPASTRPELVSVDTSTPSASVGGFDLGITLVVLIGVIYLQFRRQ